MARGKRRISVTASVILSLALFVGMATGPRSVLATPGGAGFIIFPEEDVLINIGSAEGEPGQVVTVAVTLDTFDFEVAGTQNDIEFQPEAAIAANDMDRPDCVVNPDINKEATTFAFQPPGCTVGTDCTAVRALVLSLGNVDPIPDGSVLYTCQVAIAADAPGGSFPLTNTNAQSSDPAGMSLPTIGVDGAITVPQPTLATVEIGTAEGPAGSFVSVDVVLLTADVIPPVEVAGLQNDIEFGPAASIAIDNGQPLCAVNPDINKPDTAFAFQPPGCELGASGGAGTVACNAVRAVVIAANNVDAIASGSVLYTCTVVIAADAMGTIPLGCANQIVSNPAGNEIGSECLAGQVIVAGPPPTSTPTPTEPPPPTNTPFPPGGSTKGCAIVAPMESAVGWLLLLPPAALFWLRPLRRSKRGTA